MTNSRLIPILFKDLQGLDPPVFFPTKHDPRSRAKSNCTCSTTSGFHQRSSQCGRKKTKKTGISPVKWTENGGGSKMECIIRLTSTLNEEGQNFQGKAHEEKINDTTPSNFFWTPWVVAILPWFFFTPWKSATWNPEDYLFEEENPSEPNLRFTRSMGPIIYLFRGEMRALTQTSAKLKELTQHPSHTTKNMTPVTRKNSEPTRWWLTSSLSHTYIAFFSISPTPKNKVVRKTPTTSGHVDLGDGTISKSPRSAAQCSGIMPSLSPCPRCVAMSFSLLQKKIKRFFENMNKPERFQQNLGTSQQTVNSWWRLLLGHLWGGLSWYQSGPWKIWKLP